MKNISVLNYFLLLLSSSYSLYGARVLVSNVEDVNFVSIRDGSTEYDPLDTAFVARVGYLENILGISSYDEIFSNWTDSGSSVAFATGEMAGGYNGHFYGNYTFTNDVGLADKDVYVWVTNGNNENALLKHSVGRFPSDSDIANVPIFSIQQSRLQSGEWIVILGEWNQDINTQNGGSIVLANIPIPEPSGVVLAGLAMGALFGRRRRS